MKKIVATVAEKFNFDAHYALHGGFWLLTGHVFTILAVLTTSYFFANYLDPALYGNYRYLISATVVVSLFSLSGIDTAVIQAVAKNVKGFFKHALKTSLRYGLITTSVALLAAIYYYLQSNHLLATGFLIIGLLQPLVASSGLVYSYFYGKQDFQAGSWWHVLKTLVTTAITATTVFLTNDVILILLAFFIGNLLANTLPCFFHRKILFELDTSVNLQKFVGYAKHTSVQNVLTGVANQLDKILIFQTLGARELATYAFATAIPDQYKGVTKTIDTLLLPRFSKYTLGVIKIAIWRKTIVYFVFLLIGAGLYILATPYIFAILYPAYADSVFLSQLYVLGIIFGFGGIPFAAMKAEMNNSILYKYKLTTAIVQILSLILLMNLYGLIGAVFARIFYRAFVCIYSYLLFFSMKENK